MAHASEAFRREAEGTASEVAGAVRLSVSDFVGIEVVPPMLATLRERYPRLAVELLLTNANTDLPGQEADVAVRMARPSQTSLVARHVGSIPLGFFASPTYLDRHGVPGTVADFRQHAMVGPDRMPAYVAVLDALGREADETHAIDVVAEIELAQAQSILTGLVLDAGTNLFDALGASATRFGLALDRHWRNARTISSHNPRIFKDRIVGDFAVNGTEPPFQWKIGQSLASGSGT